MIRSMLVAVDETPVAAVVVQRAAELSKALGARVILFRAMDAPVAIPAAAHATPDGLEEVLREQGRAFLRSFTVEIPHADLEVVVSGSESPWRVVVEAADRLAVDLIVIGSHGYHGLDRLLGTNAVRVADRAHRDVWIVHS